MADAPGNTKHRETWIPFNIWLSEMKATQQGMVKSRIPLEYRDYCAHLLMPLNKCRGETFYLPWKCENERHEYEKCQYDEWVFKTMPELALTEARPISFFFFFINSYKRRMRALQKAKEDEE